MDLEKGKAHFGRKPPTHFHFQEEYIQVTEGILAVEVEGKEMRLTAADGVFTVRPYVNHRLYPTPISSQDSGHVIRFLLSGQKMPQPYNMDVIFFENWYKYQDHVVVDGAPISLIQVLSVGRPHQATWHCKQHIDNERYLMAAGHTSPCRAGYHSVRQFLWLLASWLGDGWVVCLDTSLSIDNGPRTGSWLAKRCRRHSTIEGSQKIPR